MKKEFIYVISAIPKAGELVDIDNSVVASYSNEYDAQSAALKYDEMYTGFDHVIKKLEVKYETNRS